MMGKNDFLRRAFFISSVWGYLCLNGCSTVVSLYLLQPPVSESKQQKTDSERSESVFK